MRARSSTSPLLTLRWSPASPLSLSSSFLLLSQVLLVTWAWACGGAWLNDCWALSAALGNSRGPVNPVPAAPGGLRGLPVRALGLPSCVSELGRTSRSCLNCELRRQRYFCSTRLWRLREWQWSAVRSGAGLASGLVDGDGMSVRCFLLLLGAFCGWGWSVRRLFVLLSVGSGLWCRFLDCALLGFGFLGSSPVGSPLQRSMMFRQRCLALDSPRMDAADVPRILKGCRRACPGISKLLCGVSCRQWNVPLAV